MLNQENPFKLEFENSQVKIYTEIIKGQLSLMKNRQYCTSNLRLIEYFEENNFKPLIQEDLISKILKEYKNNPSKFILPNNNGNYKSEKLLKKSVNITISSNKIFMKGPDLGQISLNLENAKKYLETIYKKENKDRKDIRSPNKRPKNQGKPTKNIWNKNNKDKNYINQDEVPIEIEEYNEKKNGNNNLENEIKDKNNNSIESTRYFGITREKKQENNENKIIVPKTNNIKIKKEKNNLFPKIFLKNIDLDNFSSLYKRSIQNALDSLDNLLLVIKSKKKNDINEKELEKIKIELQEIQKNKISYNNNIKELSRLKDDLFNIFKLMDSQLKSIIILIESPNYRYEMYIESQNLLLSYGTLYNEAVDKFKSLLLALKKYGKEIIDNFVKIKKLLNYCNNSIYFSELEKIFENNLQLDYYINCDNSHFDIKDNIIYEFTQEKDKIIHEMEKIDDLVGNIEIY